MSTLRSDTRLLFVYNADGGLLNALKDMAHKALAPGSYPCSLCATTYGAVALKPEWRDYVAKLPYAAVFLHRDEWQWEWPALAGEPLPAILLQEGAGTPRLLVGASDLPLGQSVADLKAVLDERLARQPGQAV